jgi:hypothetical protein
MKRNKTSALKDGDRYKVYGTEGTIKTITTDGPYYQRGTKLLVGDNGKNYYAIENVKWVRDN